MMANNWERLNIVLSQKNRFDYAEFTSLCKEKNIVPLPMIMWSQKVDCLMRAIEKYPDLPPNEAYLQEIKDNDSHIILMPVAGVSTASPKDIAPKQGCGGCGGGTIR